MFQNITARKKKQTQLTQQPSVANVLQSYLDSRSSVTTTPSIDIGNSIQSLFKAMADSVIALPPDLQLKIKIKFMQYSLRCGIREFNKEFDTIPEQATAAIKAPSFTSFQFTETHLTPRALPQNIQEQQVQYTSGNIQHNIDSRINAESNSIPGRTNNESNIIVDINPHPHSTTYVITKERVLVPQDQISMM